MILFRRPTDSRALGERDGSFSKYTTKNPLERALVQRFLRTFDAEIESLALSTVLEVGVGEGMIAERVRSRFPQALFIVLDLPNPDLSEAWKARGLKGVYADAAHLPIRDSSIDLFLGIEVLEHLSDPDLALGEMVRAGRGHAILSVPLEPIWRIGNMLRGRYVKQWGNTPTHLQHWGRRSFRRLVARYFRIERLRRPFPWTLVVGSVRRDSASLNTTD